MSAPEANSEKAARKPLSRHGLQSAAAAVSRIAAPMWRKRGFAESRIITDWAAIVGDAIAPYCVPLRIARPQRHGGGGALYVRAAGAWAVELHHLSPQILDRVNSFLGFQAVTELKIVQGPVPSAPQRRRPKPLPPDARHLISEAVSEVPDDGLRDALERLGEALHKRA
jgi:hypothetical protein